MEKDEYIFTDCFYGVCSKFLTWVGGPGLETGQYNSDTGYCLVCMLNITSDDECLCRGCFDKQKFEDKNRHF